MIWGSRLPRNREPQTLFFQLLPEALDASPLLRDDAGSLQKNGLDQPASASTEASIELAWMYRSPSQSA